jgi:hypothetical protein
MRYQCHINVEVCSSITVVKYFYKYVYKGHDRALVVVQPEARALSVTTPQAVAGGADGNNVHAAWDEVQNYLDGRYVSANEACHRLFAFELHNMHPNVYRLAVHLPNEKTTYFPEGTMVGEAMMRNNSTTLIGWCDFNRKAKFEYVFKIPVSGLCGSFACYVPLNSPQATLIRAARLIVWDEAPMAHKHVFEAMNRTL